MYLTADSEHELEDFKDDEVYIIGGIVDRNRYRELDSEQGQRAGHQARAAANRGSPQDVRHARAHRQPDARHNTRAARAAGLGPGHGRCAHAKENAGRGRGGGEKRRRTSSIIASYGHRRDECNHQTLELKPASSSTCPHSCANCLRSRPREAQGAPQRRLYSSSGAAVLYTSTRAATTIRVYDERRHRRRDVRSD